MQLQVKVKTYKPRVKERVIKMNKGQTIKELLNKLKIKSIEDYAIITNGTSTTDLSMKLEQDQYIVVMPQI